LKNRKAIWRLQILAIEETCKSHYSQEEIQAWTRLLKPERYDNAICRKELFVAEEHGSVVGFGQLDSENSRIEELYVHPGYTGRHIGSHILQAMESAAAKAGVKTLHLTATLNAVPFYEKAGYSMQLYRKYLLPSGQVACVLLARELP